MSGGSGRTAGLVDRSSVRPISQVMKPSSGGVFPAVKQMGVGVSQAGVSRVFPLVVLCLPLTG